jgi:biotin transport system substrate-specific component
MKKELVLEKPAISSTVFQLAGIAAVTGLMIISAQIAIPLPFTPVPLTLQTLVVLLGAAFLGARNGVASQISYLALGGLGLPVFAGGAMGLARLLGPTGGYLLGFVVASYFLGYVLKKENISWPKLIMAMTSAIFIIHFLGALRLAGMLHLTTQKAFLMGSLPFLPGEAIKIMLASLIYRGTKTFFPAR